MSNILLGYKNLGAPWPTFSKSEKRLAACANQAADIFSRQLLAG
jgi:hypothetical protein